jgi:competence protein ComEA
MRKTIVINKKLKIIFAVLIFIIACIIGTVIEHSNNKELIVQSISTADDDYIEASEDTEINVSAEAEGRININTAPAYELVELKGIGEKLAEKIIAYRTENGNFNTVDDLALVSGISENTVNEIRDKICAE